MSLAACDTGDGTTLQDPVAPTTLAPVDTTPLPSLPLGDSAIDETPLVGDTPVSEAPVDDMGDIEPFDVITPWADGEAIDPRFTCDGGEAAPDIAWTGVPDGTVELALSLVDESNLRNGEPFVQWVVAGIDPDVGQVVRDDLPPGAFEGINFAGVVGYSGPCPDPGTSGVYVLRLFAVGQQVEAGFDTPAADLLGVIDAVSFDVASTSGTYSR